MQFSQKLDQLEKRFDELNAQMADPAVISDAAEYRKVTKAHSEISEIVGKYRDWKRVEDALSQARPMLEDRDPDLKAMAQEEVTRLEPELAAIEEELKVLLLPKDPLDEKNVVLGNPRRHGRRRSYAVRRRDLSHVQPLRRDAGLED